MTRSEERAFIRGYVQAVAEVARLNANHGIDLQRALSAPNITRDDAKRAGVDVDLQILDEKQAWPIYATGPIGARSDA